MQKRALIPKRATRSHQQMLRRQATKRTLQHQAIHYAPLFWSDMTFHKCRRTLAKRHSQTVRCCHCNQRTHNVTARHESATRQNHHLFLQFRMVSPIWFLSTTILQIIPHQILSYSNSSSQANSLACTAKFFMSLPRLSRLFDARFTFWSKRCRIKQP
jgi:hypothetical protein